MRFAKCVFRLAGIYGLVLLVPFYFLEHAIAAATTPISHPEYFYGFVGAALSAQRLFLLIYRDPQHYRLAMIPSIVEKISFAIPAWILFLERRVGRDVVTLGTVDLCWAVLFCISFARTGGSKDARLS